MEFMAMEARGALTCSDHQTSCTLLSLPQSQLRFHSRIPSGRKCSALVYKQASTTTRTTTTTTRRKTSKGFGLCHCSAVSSIVTTPDADQRLELALSVGSAVIPHPAKVEKGGEDAFFVSNYSGGVLGVADGVSGWAEENVDPALFSRELMEHAVSAIDSEEIGHCPRQLLAKAHEATSATGAATAIVAILEREGGVLHIANLGDCGVRIIRKGSIVFATSTQQHYFDCPYQLSSEAGAQTASDAMVYKVEVALGDIIIMGSDGLFDNVYDKDVEKTVSFFGGSDEDFPQRIATALASLASKNAKDTKYESPYSQEAILQGHDLPLWKKLLGLKLTGGKLDDITVLAAHVIVGSTLPKDLSAASSEQATTIATLAEEEEIKSDTPPHELLTPAVT